MGDNFNIGTVTFDPVTPPSNMIVEVDKTQVRFPKIAFWVMDAAGLTWVAMARVVRRFAKLPVLILEGASGAETLVAVVSYNRLGAPVSLEAGIELKDADGKSNLEIPFRQIRSIAGDTTALWTP